MWEAMVSKLLSAFLVNRQWCTLSHWASMTRWLRVLRALSDSPTAPAMRFLVAMTP